MLMVWNSKGTKQYDNKHPSPHAHTIHGPRPHPQGLGAVSFAFFPARLLNLKSNDSIMRAVPRPRQCGPACPLRSTETLKRCRSQGSPQAPGQDGLGRRLPLIKVGPCSVPFESNLFGVFEACALYRRSVCFHPVHKLLKDVNSDRMRHEIVPRDLRMKDKFLKHLTGPLYFSPKCSKHFHRLYHNTRDCTVPAFITGSSERFHACTCSSRVTKHRACPTGTLTSKQLQVFIGTNLTGSNLKRQVNSAEFLFTNPGLGTTVRRALGFEDRT
ncbi:Protein FAM150B [Myotis brandtii]|uniref:Protein FAM150B n=1 Tax=Myotis brandtii TaxID=109478 RepID=S7MVB5_MYOBR|nr:Protein FAM150B [Myotis brandtii]